MWADYMQDVDELKRIEEYSERRSCTHGEQEMVRETPAGRVIFRCVNCNALLPS